MGRGGGVSVKGREEKKIKNKNTLNFDALVIKTKDPVSAKKKDK